MRPVTVEIVTVTRRKRLTLTGYDIIGLLRQAGHDIPETASATFDVPGGGDWSNTTLCCDASGSPLTLAWEEVDTTRNTD